MTIITGTGDFQQMFQNELYEVVQVGGQNFIMPIVKLSDDSVVSSSEIYVTSGTVSVSNFPSMYPITGSISVTPPIIQGISGTVTAYIQSGTVIIYGNGMVSQLNSTYTPLGANGVFTGTAENITEYSTIIITTHPDKASKTDGLEFQFSPDGITFQTTDTYTIGAGLCKTYALQPVAPYFRIRYTNGALAQSSFAICTQYKKAGGVDRSHRVADDISGQDDANLVKAIIAAEQPGNAGTYTNVQATNGGNLKIALEEIDPTVLPISVSITTGSAGTVNTTFTDDFYHDSFGRLRTSDANTRFDVEFSNDDQPLIMDKVTVGGATATYNSGTRDVSLSVVSTTGTASSTFASHFHVPYTPGNSQLIDITGTMDYAGIRSGTVSIIIMNGGVETAYQQQNWRYANNASTIDWTKSQIMAIDFQSLKVGRLRVGFVRNGTPSLAHIIENDNIRSNGYWQRPNLPVFWKIYNSGTSTISEMGYGDVDNGIFLRHSQPINANAKSLAICATVKSEGGLSIYDMPGFPFAFSNGATTRSVGTTKVPICSIQVQTLFKGIKNRSLIVPTGLSFLTDNPIFYEVVLNPSLSGSVFNVINIESGVYGDISATSYTGGTVIYSDFVGGSAARSNAQNSGFTGRIPLSINYRATVGDILTVSVVRVGTNNAAVSAAIQYKEIR